MADSKHNLRPSVTYSTITEKMRKKIVRCNFTETGWILILLGVNCPTLMLEDFEFYLKYIPNDNQNFIMAEVVEFLQ